MRDWLLIYHDGNDISFVSDTQQSWNSAPTQNVQILLLRERNYFKIIQGLDEYEIEWTSTNVKFGSTITDEQWRAVRNFVVSGAWNAL
jgi:hypothetical protein